LYEAFEPAEARRLAEKLEIVYTLIEQLLDAVAVLVELPLEGAEL
jgi:hypothetical protein